MNEIIFSVEAYKDFEEIIGYINQHNPESAKETFLKIKKTISVLKEYRDVGVEKPEITSEPLRFLLCGKYVIGYNPNKNPIEIVRILSGEMDLFDGSFF
jgi:plasmid stabilization system protein ParE